MDYQHKKYTYSKAGNITDIENMLTNTTLHSTYDNLHRFFLYRSQVLGKLIYFFIRDNLKCIESQILIRNFFVRIQPDKLFGFNQLMYCSFIFAVDLFNCPLLSFLIKLINSICDKRYSLAKFFGNRFNLVTE